MTIWLFVILLGVSGGVFYILKTAGVIKIGADAVIGCQNTKMISSFFGRPGTNLTSYNFFGNDITVNEKIVPFLEKIQKEIKDSKIEYNFNNVSSYNYRSKRGGGGTSLHSWGIAIDINPDSNPFQSGYSDVQTDIPQEVIDIFKKHGFFWGGDWHGAADPMHFEWYGAGISGQALDSVSKQKVIDLATAVDRSGSPNSNGEYDWIVPAGTHELTAVGRGYKETKINVELTCFRQEDINLTLEPVPSNVPGSIAGNIKISGNYPMLVPANVFLDGRVVATSNIKGDYYIPNVKEGNHKVEAKIMFFPGSTTVAQIVPGENLKNFNILIGK